MADFAAAAREDVEASARSSAPESAGCAAALPLAPIPRRERAPETDVAPDDPDPVWIRRRATTIYDGTGTGRTGAIDMAVVDARLRVHGIARLRVADGPILRATSYASASAIVTGRTAATMPRDDTRAGPAA